MDAASLASNIGAEGGGIADAFEVWAVDERHLPAPADYSIDADHEGEELIVAYWGQ